MTLDALDVLDDDALNALDVDGIARAAANKRARVDVGCARVETNENVAPSADVRATLKARFGLDAFRPGQREVVEAVLAGRDACVFWSTGSGKSLPYQLAAFASGKSAVVVSPLISLMQDQVTALNNTVGRGDGKDGDVAVFLGSAQMDHGAEARVFEGAYEIVYCTPEKLTASDSFLNGLKSLAARGRLGLIAIDEAHCISAWGHDFRPSYTQLHMLRDAIPNVPIMALTATAVRHVRDDISKILRLRDPYVSVNSVDRTNLHINVVRRTDFSRDLDYIVERVRAGARVSPAIVYCPTIAEVVKVAGALKQRLGDDVVRMYHGQMSPPERHDAHMDFLTSRSPVIVATTAFGMGIDKPDVRAITLLGASKTMEEFYQQIGRAGRDGLASEVSMLFTDGDFTRYASDFYTKDLTPQARDAQAKSTNALKEFALNRETCRRVMIMKHFGETAPFVRCGGTCDNCARSERGDERRNFAKEALPVLFALRYAGSQPSSRLLDTIMGTTKNAASLQPWQRQAIDNARRLDDLQPGCSSREFYKEILSLLSQVGLVRARTVKGAHSTYPVYDLDPQAQDFLQQQNSNQLPPLMLICPESVLAAEREMAKKADEIKARLVGSGVDVARIPAHELASGRGEQIDAELEWINRLDYYKGTPRAEALVDLLSQIEQWRDSRARELGMAPAAVLSAHLCKKIAYTAPRSVEALRAVGVRVTGVESLSKLINDAMPKVDVETTSNGALELSLGTIAPNARWHLAEYKPKKGPGGTMVKPNWEVSYERFTSGEHVETIALTTQPKAVQPATVFNHLLEALLHAKPLDYDRAASYLPASQRLTKSDCAMFADVQLSKRVDVVAERAPSTRAFLADVIRDVPSASKFDAERQRDAVWYTKLRTWIALRRAGAV